jgi:hypothetical protein
MVDLRPDSVLAKKLNTFLTLSKDELHCLADLQRHPVNVRRGQQLTREGQTGQSPCVRSPGGLGVQLQDPSRRWAPDHFLSDRRGHCRAAQRLATDGGPFLFRVDRFRGQFGRRLPHYEVRHRISAPGCRAIVGRFA